MVYTRHIKQTTGENGMKITKVERTGSTLIVKTDDNDTKVITSKTNDEALDFYNDIVAQITTAGFYELN